MSVYLYAHWPIKSVLQLLLSRQPSEQSDEIPYFFDQTVWLLFEGGVYFFGIYTSLAKYKKLVKQTNNNNNKKTRTGMTLSGLKAGAKFELFDTLLLCYKVIHTTLPVHSLAFLSSPCDFTRRLSPMPQKVPHFAWNLSWNVANYQLPSLRAYSEAIVTVLFLDRYRK